MLQVIATLAVAIWFFRSARLVGRSGIGWAVIGALVVLVPSIAWGIFVRVAIFPSLFRSSLEDTSLTATAIAVGSLGVIVGVLLSVWVHRINLRSATPTAAGEASVERTSGNALLVSADDYAKHLRQLGYKVDQVSAGTWQIYGKGGVDKVAYGEDSLKRIHSELAQTSSDA